MYTTLEAVMCSVIVAAKALDIFETSVLHGMASRKNTSLILRTFIIKRVRSATNRL